MSRCSVKAIKSRKVIMSKPILILNTFNSSFFGPACFALPIHRCQKTNLHNRTRDVPRTRKNHTREETTSHVVSACEDWAVLPRQASEAIQDRRGSNQHVRFARPFLRNPMISLKVGKEMLAPTSAHRACPARQAHLRSPSSFVRKG